MMGWILIFSLTGCGKHAQVIREINQQIENKNLDEALSVMRKALREDPKNPQLLRQQVILFLHSEDVNYAIAAYRRLQEVDSDNPILVKAVRHENPVVRVTASKALGLLKSPDAAEALIQATRDPEKSVRQAAVLALGDLKAAKAIPALISALDDDFWYVRAEAASALGKIGDARAATRLFGMLEDEDPYVRDNAREALQDLATDENRGAYLKALDSNNSNTRFMAAVALARTGDNSGIDVLLKELNKPESPELITAIKAASHLHGSQQALAPLRKLTRHNNDAIAANAILALGELKDRESVSMLKNILKDQAESKAKKTASLMALNLIAEKNL
jgi:HEAT repeat protein